MRETQVRSLGREDPLGKEMAPTPVFLLGQSHEQRSLVGYSPWGHEELETTEQLSTQGQHDPISTFIIPSVAHLFQDTRGKKRIA